MLKRVEKELGLVDELVVPSLDKANHLRDLLKEVFEVSVSASAKTFGDLSLFHVDGLDSETIWQQLQMRNRPVLRFVKRKTASLVTSTRRAKGALQKGRNAKDRTLIVARAQEENADDNEECDDDDDDDDDDDHDDDDVGMEEEDSEEGDFEGEDDFEMMGEGLDRDGEEEDSEEGEEEEFAGLDDREQSEYAVDEDPVGSYIDKMSDWLDETEEREEKHQKKLARLEKLNAHKSVNEEVCWFSILFRQDIPHFLTPKLHCNNSFFAHLTGR